MSETLQEHKTYKYDPLGETSAIIYENYRRKRLETMPLNLGIFICSILLAICITLLIMFINYGQVDDVINVRTEILDKELESCNYIAYGVIDFVSTPIAVCAVILFILIYKRRVFLRDKFKYRNVGLPMIVTTWSKTNRFYTAVTYGLIAYNIYEIVLSVLKFDANGPSQADIDIRNLNDKSGIVKLLFRVTQVILVGISNMIDFNLWYRVHNIIVVHSQETIPNMLFLTLTLFLGPL
jgi:hypothetical protein